MTITQQQVLHAGDGRRSGPLTESCDNVLAWRAGEACSAASKAKAGDYIDRGLALIIELRKQGLHVVQASDGQYIEQSTAQPQAVVPAPPQEFESAQGRALASAWAEFRGTVARKDFEAWGEEVLPLLDGMAAAPVVQAVPDSVKFICVDCTGCEKCRASSGATPADVRMLTGDEHEELENALGLAVYLSVARVIQQKFCEVNAGKRIPADGVIGGV